MRLPLYSDEASLAGKIDPIDASTDVPTLYKEWEAAKQRVAELKRADEALRKTMTALAEDADLSSVVAKLLMTAGEQLEAPVVEYWVHESDTVARLVMSCREGRIYDGSDIPDDPRVGGISIPESMTGADSLYTLRDHFVSQLANDPIQRAVFEPLGLDLQAWCRERGVATHLNVQLRFGHRSLGSLVTYFGDAKVLTDSRIELAYSLANQIALVMRLTYLSGQAQTAALERERAKAAQERLEDLARRDAMLGAVAEFSQLLVSSGTLKEIMPAALRRLLLVDGVSRVIVGKNELTSDGELVNRYIWEEVREGLPLQRENPRL